MEKYIPSTTGRLCQPSPSKSFSHLQINQLRESLRHLREENQNYQKEIRILNQSVAEISSNSQKLELAIADRLKEIEKIRRNTQRAESELESIQNSSFKEQSDYEDSEKLYNEKKENKRSVTSLSRRLDIFREMSANYKNSKAKLDKLKEIQKYELLFHRLIKINQDLTSQAQILLNNNSGLSNFSTSNSRSPSQFRSQNNSNYSIESPLKKSNYSNGGNNFTSPTSTIRAKGNSRIYNGLLTGLGQKLKQNYRVIQALNKNRSLSTSSSPNSHSSLRPSYFNQDNSSLSSPRILNSHVFNCNTLINDDFNFGINDDRYTKANIDRLVREKGSDLRMNYDYRDLSILIDRFERFKDGNQKRAIARDKKRSLQMKTAGNLKEVDSDTVHADLNEDYDENIPDTTQNKATPIVNKKITFNFSSSPVNNANNDSGNTKKRIKFVSSHSNANNNNNNNNNNQANTNLASKSSANADPIRMKKPLMKKSPPRIEKDRPTSIIDDRRNVIDNLSSKPPPISPISPTDLNSEPSDGGNVLGNLQQVAENISHSLLDESPSTPTAVVITSTESPVDSNNEYGNTSRLSASSTESPIIKPEGSLLSQLDSDDDDGDDGKFQLLFIEEEEEDDSDSGREMRLSDLDDKPEDNAPKNSIGNDIKNEAKVITSNDQNKSDDNANKPNKDDVKDAIEDKEKDESNGIGNVMLIESISDDDNNSESNDNNKNETVSNENKNDSIKTDDKINDIVNDSKSNNDKNEIVSNENENNEQSANIEDDGKNAGVKDEDKSDNVNNDDKENEIKSDDISIDDIKDIIISDGRSNDIKNDEQEGNNIDDAKKDDTAKDEQNDNITDDAKINVVKNEEQNDDVTDDTNVNDIENNDKENAITNDDKENAITGDDKENAITNDDKENVIANDDKENAITNDDKENAITNDDKENAITNDDKETAITNDDKETAITNDDKETAITNDDKENVIANDDKINDITNDDKENVISNDDKNANSINDNKISDIHSTEYSSSGSGQSIGGASLRARHSSSRNEAKNKISPTSDIEEVDDQPSFSPKPPETAQTTPVKSPLIMKALSKDNKTYSSDTYSDVLNKNIPIDKSNNNNNTTIDYNYEEEEFDDEINPNYNRQKQGGKFAFSREIMKNHLAKRILRASLIAKVSDLECQVSKLQTEIQMLEDQLKLNEFERGIEAEKKKKMQIEREQELERERIKQRKLEIQNMRHTYEKDVQNYYVDMKRDEADFNQFKMNRMTKSNNNNSSINSKSSIGVLYDNQNEMTNDIIDNDYYNDYVKHYRNDAATEFDLKSTETTITKQDIDKIEKIQKLRLLLYNLDQENKDLRSKYEEEKRKNKAALYIEAATKLQTSIETKKQIMLDGNNESVKCQQNLEKLQIRLNDEISKNELIREKTDRILQKPKPSATGMARAKNDLKLASDAIKRKMNSLRKEEEIIDSKINEINQICDSDKIDKKKRKINVLKNAFKRRNDEDLSPIVELNEIEHLKKMLDNLKKNTIQIKQEESDYEKKIKNDLNELYRLSSNVPSHYFQSSGNNLALSTFSSFSSNTNSMNAANNRNNIVFTPPVISQFDQQNYLVNTI